MATAIANRRNMIEVKEPRMLKFEKPNDSISGHLYAIQQIQLDNKPAVQYDMLDELGEHVTFLQTYDLGRKLRKEHIGHYVQIIFEGEDKRVQTQGRALRRFKVLVSELKEIDPELGF